MSILAVDIGGANLKFADAQGHAWAEPFALWQQPEVLASQLMEHWPAQPPAVVLATMTGELCDCFTDRAEGVRFILDHLEAAAEGSDLWLWSMTDGFINPKTARQQPMTVAAGNWHALGQWLAPMFSTGLSLLIDIGSTTTDLLRLRDGVVSTNSQSDTDRLQSGELVYLGAGRTPLMAVASQVALDRPTGVMAEHFATMADALILTADEPEPSDDSNTPDGRSCNASDAARRILRMIGSDLNTHDQQAAVRLAHQFRDAAIDRLRQAISAVLGDETPDRLILSGGGARLGHALISTWSNPPRCIALSEKLSPNVAEAACAHALVKLWERSSP
jgi:probable H4MPT-linked C1 transfer pathway protein